LSLVESGMAGGVASGKFGFRPARSFTDVHKLQFRPADSLFTRAVGICSETLIPRPGRCRSTTGCSDLPQRSDLLPLPPNLAPNPIPPCPAAPESTSRHVAKPA